MMTTADVRARELARNECPDKLKGKVERMEGRDIGLDKRFVYYRFRPGNSRQDILSQAAKLVRDFDNPRLPVFA
jgi:hypothetical protein